MWNGSKSLKLSKLMLDFTLVLWLVLIIPIIYLAIKGNIEMVYAVCYGLCYIPMIFCFVNVDKFLKNIANGIIFDKSNVEFLRRVSYSCFFAALILLVFAVFNWLFIPWSGIIGFFGLLMRVIKNMLDEAIVIKNENDFTI